MKNSPIFFLLLCFIGFQSHALKKLEDLSPPAATQWLKLMHYNKNLFGGFSGSVRNPEFYFTEKGSTQPEEELQGAFQALQQAALQMSSLPENKNPFCRFPARVIWFRKNFPQETQSWPQAHCPVFEKYLNGLSGESISVVFSSYYLNNPSSAFGHSFLRINKSPGKAGQRFELLDYGINFAANVDTGNPLLYAIKGLSGGFLGSFTSIPYYFKVREYNNAESRDLWEYELNVDHEFVNFFIAHLWEMGPTDVRYYYLSENCSYWILALVDAIDPSLRLVERMKSDVIPSDTIRLLWDTPGLVKKYKFRPSIHSEFAARLTSMTDMEKDRVLQIEKQQKIDVNDLTNEQKQNVLDAALDYHEYKFPTAVQIQETHEAQFKNKLLAARSQVNLTSPPLNLTPDPLSEPHLSHGSRRISFGGYGTNTNGNFLHFQYRFALHDQLDPIQGYPEYAEIVFGDFDFSYSQKLGRAEFEKFTLFEVLSNTEYTKIEPHISWRVRVGADRVRLTDFPLCHGATFELGGGYTSSLGLSDRLLIYGGIKGTTHYLPACEGQFVAGAGPNMRVHLKLTPRWLALAEGYWRYDNLPTKSYRETSIATQWSPNEHWGLRTQATQKNHEQSIQLDLITYF